ncbi:MAG: prolyl oligopeptidase family serine peptidase [Gammaproteobacteria bacterium]|nr:prolyl oligopeptidase family serine peptidase [Gammaproteobacteria bacterium]
MAFYLKQICSLMIFLFVCSNAWGLEEINFLSEPGPHSPFKIKRAKAKGETLLPKERIKLTGFLGRPDDRSPSPAIIMLHSGFGLQDFHKKWATQLTEWGFVTLLIYSYADKKSDPQPTINMSRDVISNAYGAYEYLRNQSYVDRTRIAVMGWSSGGRHALSLIGEEPPPGRIKTQQFKAGVMIYPNCPPEGGKFRSPMLILLGDNDQYLVNGDCGRFKVEAQRQNNEQVVEVHVYPGATHFFDDSNQPHQDKQAVIDSRYRYSPDAHEDSLKRVRHFFDRYLKR